MSSTLLHRLSSMAGKKLGFVIKKYLHVFVFLSFLFRKVLLGIAYILCRQYARNSAATLTTHTLITLLI